MTEEQPEQDNLKEEIERRGDDELPAKEDPNEETVEELEESEQFKHIADMDDVYGDSAIDLFEESFFSLLASIVYSPLPFITVVALGSFLSPLGLGIFYFGYTIVEFGKTPHGAVANTMRKKGSEAGKDIGAYFSWALFVGVVYSVIIGVLGVALAGILPRFVPLTASSVHATAFALISVVFFITGLRLQDATGSPHVAGWIATGRDLAFVAVAIIIGGVIGATEPSHFLYGYGVISLTGALIAFGRVRVWPTRPFGNFWEEALGYLKYEFPNVVLGRLMLESPSLYIGILVGGAALGVFESGARPTVFISFLTIAIADPLLVMISQKSSIGQPIDETLATAFNVSLIPPLMFFMPIVGLGPQVFDLLFEGPAETIWIVALLVAVARAGYSVRRIMSKAIRGTDSPEKITRIVLFGAAGTLTLFPLGAYLGGSIGISVAFVVVQLSVAFAVSHRALNHFNVVTLNQPLLYHQLVASVLGIITIAILQLVYGLPTIYHAIGYTVTGIIVFVGTLLVVNRRARHALGRSLELLGLVEDN